MAKSLPSKARKSRSRSRSRSKKHQSLPLKFSPNATAPSFPNNAEMPAQLALTRTPKARQNQSAPAPLQSLSPRSKQRQASLPAQFPDDMSTPQFFSERSRHSRQNQNQSAPAPLRSLSPRQRKRQASLPAQFPDDMTTPQFFSERSRQNQNQSAPAPLRSMSRSKKRHASLPIQFPDDMAAPQFSRPSRRSASPKRSPPRRRRQAISLPATPEDLDADANADADVIANATLPQPKRRPMSPSYKHQSAPVRSPQRDRVTGRPYASLLTDFSGMGTPQFEAKSFDKLFWEDFRPGQNIRKYIQKQIKRFNLELAPIHTTRRGEICKVRERPMRLFKYQTLNSVLGSPYSPINRLLIVASTGTGKSCILVGIANYHLLENRKHHIVFVGATLSLYTNFIRQSMSCPGKMYKISQEHGWTDPTDNSHVQAFARHMKQFIVPLNYTQFGNMLSKKYKKYEGVDTLENKIVLMDEAHYLVDSVNTATCEPMYTRVVPSWRSNLKTMYKAMVLPNNPYLKNVRLIGATATPLTSSLTEFLALANIFTDHPLPQTTLCEAVRKIGEIEEGRGDDKSLTQILSTFNPIFSQSVTMYLSKTLTRVLDTNIFPEMVFEVVPVAMAESQERIIAKHWP
jgi:Type III restriction enzyme, res subunit